MAWLDGSATSVVGSERLTLSMTEEASSNPLLPAEIVDSGGLDLIAARLVDAARSDGIALTGDGGLLPALLSRVLSAGLEAELTGVTPG